jgi:hypothetical protein
MLRSTRSTGWGIWIRVTPWASFREALAMTWPEPSDYRWARLPRPLSCSTAIGARWTSCVTTRAHWSSTPSTSGSGPEPPPKPYGSTPLAPGALVDDVWLGRGRQGTFRGPPTEVSADGELQEAVESRTWIVEHHAWSVLVPP